MPLGTLISGVKVWVFLFSSISFGIFDDVPLLSKFLPQTTQNFAVLRFLPLQAGHTFFESFFCIISCSGGFDDIGGFVTGSSLVSGVLLIDSDSFLGSEKLTSFSLFSDVWSLGLTFKGSVSIG